MTHQLLIVGLYRVFIKGEKLSVVFPENPIRTMLRGFNRLIRLDFKWQFKDEVVNLTKGDNDGNYNN